MLKGAHKQMIVVRTRDSRLFEEAHFVMRRGAATEAGDDLDLVFEANRIIENSLPKPSPLTVPPPAATVPSPQLRHRRCAHREAGMGLVVGLVWYVGGFLSGAGVIALLWWIL